MNARITIVTPSFNQANFLEKTIDSVLSQNYPNLEYIVIDGGSTDASLAIIHRYKAHLTHWESQKDNGPASAINRGLSLATGKIFAYLNSDDTYEPGALQKVSEHFVKKPSTDIVYGDIRFIDKSGHRTTFPNKNVTVYRASPFIPGALFHDAMFVPQQASFWSSQVSKAVGAMNEENWTCWDHDFFIRAALAGCSFSRIPQILAAFRIHDTSISSQNRWQDRRIKDHQRIAALLNASGYRRSIPKRYFYRYAVQLLRSARYIAPRL